MYFDTTEYPIKPHPPNFQYEGRNGYDEPAVESAPGEKTTTEELHQHRSAQYILTQKDRPIPTLQQMKEDSGPDDLSSLKQRISQAQEQHLSDMERLYTFHADEYLSDARDMYNSIDDAYLPDEGEEDPTTLQAHADFEDFLNDPRKYPSSLPDWDDDIARLRRSHFILIKDLREKYRQLENEHIKQIAAEEVERKLREAQFPKSVEDFHAKPKVARFLALTDPAKQEKTLSEFGWAWRQVKPLQDEMANNDVFKAEVQALVIELEVKDPRKRSI